MAGAPWQDMDYGPYLTASIESPAVGRVTNLTYKGIAVNLGRAGGSGANQAILFDTDLLRYSVGWTGGFVSLKGVAFDGEHWAYPKIDGDPVFANPPMPGWAKPGEASFADPRSQAYGPLPKDWAHWSGLYLKDRQVVLSYRVGDMTVLESPALEGSPEDPVFVRVLNLGPSATVQTLQILQEPNRMAFFRTLDAPTGATVGVGDADPNATFAWLEAPMVKQEAGKILAPSDVGLLGVPWIAVKGAPLGSHWVSAGGDGHLRLQIPAHAGAVRMKLFIGRGPEGKPERLALLAQRSSPAEDLAGATKGGARRWRETLETSWKPGVGDGPYVVDELTAPESNPWKSWLRFGGLDFFADGRRAAVATWNGDVWVVSGVDGPETKLRWQRIATGLFQPLGLRIVDDEIYVLGRDQITRLHDLNGDGEADFYENFNNDCLVSEHFHEFATDLKVGPDGDFYYVKCARHALPAAHAHNGTLIRVSRDGSRFEVVARGFRAVNGLGVGPHGEFTTIDNQGHWMPGNRLNWVKPGGWYGNQWAWNPDQRSTYDEPLCWMHNFVDRSGGTQLWVPDNRWGPLKDELITMSYGMGHMFLVLKEQVGDVMQGAVTRFPLDFETGVMRGVFHPGNGQLYGAGLYGWAGNKTKAGGLYRIRYTGKPLHMASALHVASDGLVIGFTEPLDVASATDPGNYDVKAWNYRWSAQYGSPDFRLDGREGRDTWPVESATLSADRRSVFLKVAQVQRVMQVHVVFKVRMADGGVADNFIHGTIHRTGGENGLAALGSGAIGRAGETEVRVSEEAPGLRQVFFSGAAQGPSDARISRLPALHVPAGTVPSAYTPASGGRVRCRWDGFLKVDLNDDGAVFDVTGRGAVKLVINGVEVLAAEGESLDARAGKPVALHRGLNRFELDYSNPFKGDAMLRLSWTGAGHPPEPVPPTLFVHDAADGLLRRFEELRRGRLLFAERQCTQCHRPKTDWGTDAMPELATDAPRLDGVGDRLNEEWLRWWLLSPTSVRSQARMPTVVRGEDAATDARDIAAFLTRQSLPFRDRPLGAGDPAAGRKLFDDLGCAGCHALPGQQEALGASGAADRWSLADVAAKFKVGALARYLRAPSLDHVWTRMPDFKLTDDEAASLAAFVLSRSSAVAANGAGLATAGDPGRGEKRAVELGCLKCHRLGDRTDPAPVSSLAGIMAADGRRGCLAESDRDREGAPGYGFSVEERQALRAFLANGAEAALRSDSPSEFATRQYLSLRCQACHPRDQDMDFLTSIVGETKAAAAAEEGAGGSVHVGRPPLTFIGEKLHSGWMQRFLSGTLPYKPRSDLQGRMPAWAAYSGPLSKGLAQQHGYPAEDAPPVVVDAGLAEIGRKLTEVEGGFSCVSCHGVGARKALAGSDTATVNFSFVGDRIRYSYFWRYVQDPTRVMPGTMMPRFIGADGLTPIHGVFDGEPRRQFEAVWHYLHSVRTTPTPPSPPPRALSPQSVR